MVFRHAKPVIQPFIAREIFRGVSRKEKNVITRLAKPTVDLYLWQRLNLFVSSATKQIIITYRNFGSTLWQ